MGKVMKGHRYGGKWISKEVEDADCLYKKDVIARIGKTNWKYFNKWMWGQTCPVMSDKTTGYYSWNVKEFEELLVRLIARNIDYAKWKKGEWIQYASD